MKRNYPKLWHLSSALIIGCLSLSACSDDSGPKEKPLPDPYDLVLARRPGGDATTDNNTSGAYSQPVDGLTEVEDYRHAHGDRLFETNFVAKGNPIQAGLGPLYNNNSCINCHQKEGRAPFPANLNARSGFFLRISVGNDPINGPIGAPGFGGQLQQLAVTGYTPECKFAVRYEEKKEIYGDGTEVILRKPIYSVYDTYIPLPAGYMTSPRIGMPVFGLGLLEAIPEETILSYADPYDKDGDGISGRPNYVMNGETKKTMLGRFGWKANASTVLDQCAQAFVNDMGLTSYVYPVEASADQTNADPYEVKEEISRVELDAVAFYARTLAVPSPRGLETKTVKHGAQLFTDLGCAKCHVPTMDTGDSDIKALAHQTIYAYTDMLLHDMGEDLADNRPDFLATGHEWKTRPLWGIGLTYTVNGYEYYLHDGRAHTLEEAILWHGGEADKVKEKFKALKKSDRDAVITFLKAL